jgi:hypothetical protein
MNSLSHPYRTYINQSLWGQVQGIDILSGCKGNAFFILWDYQST